MKKKVYVLTQQGSDNFDQDTLEVVGVFSTKKAAKAKMEEKKGEILGYYKENFPDRYVEYGEYNIENWGVCLETSPAYDELLITEKELVI